MTGATLSDRRDTMYEIGITPEAVQDLRHLQKRDSQLVANQMEIQLKYEPARETRNRKRLRPNQLAEWELRIDSFRVFYDVDEGHRRVQINAIGYKEGNRLFVRNQEFKL